MNVGKTCGLVGPIWQERLKNYLYKNWLKVGYGMHITCTGIRPYIERESKKFHQTLMAKGMAPCGCVHLPRRRPNPHHDMTVCRWAKELKSHHISKNLTWSHCDSSKWTDLNVGHWEVAKLYMPFGCGAAECADETDPTGLLNLIQFCDHYKTSTINVQSFKTVRNTWAHAAQQELPEVQKNDAFTCMKNLLCDPELIGDLDAKEALEKLLDFEKQTHIDFEDIEEIVNKYLINYIKTILEEIESLKEQGEAHTNEIIQEIEKVKQIQIYCVQLEEKRHEQHNSLMDGQSKINELLSPAVGEIYSLKDQGEAHTNEIIQEIDKVKQIQMDSVQLEREKRHEHYHLLTDLQSKMEEILSTIKLPKHHEPSSASIETFMWNVATGQLRNCFKSIPKYYLLIVLMLSSFALLEQDIHDIGCQSNSFNLLGLKQFDFTEILTNAREGFVGRQWLFQNLTNSLLATNNTKGLIIIAAPGFGKTALISNLVCSKLSSHSISSQILGYHFCISSDRGTQNSGKFVQNLANMLADKINAYRYLLQTDIFLQRILQQECIHDASGCFEQGILAPLARLSDDHLFLKPMYIVIDALDECTHENNREGSSIVNILSKKITSFPKWLKIIATSRNVSLIRRRLSSLNQIELYHEDERNLQDIESFILKKIQISLLDQVHNLLWRNTLISELKNKSQGNFLYIKYVLDEHKNENWLDFSKWRSLPTTLESFYLDFFEQKFISVEQFRDSRKICEILVVTLQPITVDDLYNILRKENKDFHYDFDFMPLLDGLEMLLRYSTNKHYVSFYHSSLIEWLTSDSNRRGRFVLDQKEGSRLLAKYLLTKVQVNSFQVSTQFVYHLATYIVKGGELEDQVKSFLEIYPKVITVAEKITNKTALHFAAGDGDSRILEFLLPTFRDLDLKDDKGRTPVFYAVTFGHVNNLRALHKSGASLHIATDVLQNEITRGEGKNQMYVYVCKSQMCGYSLLHVASQQGHHEIVKYLLANNISVSSLTGTKDKAIHLAAEFGHIEIIKMLLNYGEQLDSTCLVYAASSRRFSVMKFLLENGIQDECITRKSFHALDPLSYWNTALHIASINGYPEMVELLLKKDNNALHCTNIFGREPIHEAVLHNKCQVVRVLLKSGADPSSVCCSETTNYTIHQEKQVCPCGFTSLHIAAYHGFSAIIDLLLQHKASYNDTDCNDMQPIHVAACRGHHDVLSTLVKNGVNINSKNSQGMTATHYACKCKASHLFDLLASLGADGFAATIDGKTPLRFIFEFGFDKTASPLADPYVQIPIEPVDFGLVYDTKFSLNMTGYEWISLSTKFLRTFQVAKNRSDIEKNVIRISIEFYTILLVDQAFPKMFFGSVYTPSMRFATLATPVVYNSDVAKAIHLYDNTVVRIFGKLTNKIFLLFSLLKDNITFCGDLLKFIDLNKVYTVDVFLSSRVNVNCKAKGLTPLLVYLRQGGRHMAKVLVKHGVTIDIKCDEGFEDSVFHLAAYHKLHYLHYLSVFQDADEWEKYLKTKDAIFDYMFDEYEKATQDGKVIRVRDGPVTKAVKTHTKGFKIIDECLDDEGYTALQRAAQGANVVAVERFLEWGANISIQTPYGFDLLTLTIWYAIKYRPYFNFHIPSVLTALEIDFASLTANTILDHLTQDKPFDIGCDMQNEAPTLLHLAATRGMWRFIKNMFVAKERSKVIGLNANCPTKHGITPIYLAKLHGGDQCNGENPWCKVVSVLLQYGGSEDIFPEPVTEYFTILYFMFHQLPGKLDLELSEKENTLLQQTRLWDEAFCSQYDDYSDIDAVDLNRILSSDIFTQYWRFLKPLKLADRRQSLLFLRYNTFLTFSTIIISDVFVRFKGIGETPFTPLLCISERTKLAISNEKAKKEIRDDPFHFHKEEDIIFSPLKFIHWRDLDFCSTETTNDVYTFEEFSHHNHHTFWASYKKYATTFSEIKEDYNDYTTKQNPRILLLHLEKYEERTNCRLGKAAYGYANLRFFLHTIKFWNEQIKRMSIYPSVSTFVAHRIHDIILNPDKQKRISLILRLAHEESSSEHKYLEMLGFGKAPMFDRTIMYHRED